MSKQAVITQKLKSHFMRNRKVTIQVNAHIKCKTVTLPITQRLNSFYIVLTKDMTTPFYFLRPVCIGDTPGEVMYKHLVVGEQLKTIQSIVCTLK